MRTGYSYAMQMEATCDESRAAEDLAMIFAYVFLGRICCSPSTISLIDGRANANAVPATIYFLVEFIRDSDLLWRARKEIEAARIDNLGQNSEFDQSKLCESPLLQSVFAETLRLRIAIVLMRSPEKRNFSLGK